MDAPPAVEREIAADLVRRGLLVAPPIVLVAGLARGWDGAASAAIALAIVFINFVVAAISVSWAATISHNAVGAVAAGGYVVRLALIFVALVLLKQLSWIDLPVLGVTLVGVHLGLLAWEAKYVSMSLAAPGLRPRRPVSAGEE